MGLRLTPGSLRYPESFELHPSHPHVYAPKTQGGWYSWANVKGISVKNGTGALKSLVITVRASFQLLVGGNNCWYTTQEYNENPKNASGQKKRVCSSRFDDVQSRGIEMVCRQKSKKSCFFAFLVKFSWEPRSRYRPRNVAEPYCFFTYTLSPLSL